ncbi:S-layer protein [Leptolyngbya iicbica LK]|uniref:S-layer protein n=3 Tax=Cyanophyceae TaxID=3028117 RepID=A0A4Q7EID2_9CYAN|nr:S-layer protein [Leptolyngbya sp. LK]
MTNKLWKVLLASPVLLGMGFAGSANAQVSTIDELVDVSPTPDNWAFGALQSLVEDYGCIEGDLGTRTYRGNQFMTRYEFAAGLNACLDSIRFLIADGGLDPETLATIQRLQEEFAAELATLRGRVDALEAETAELRAQQFSTTTKLRGQVDAHLVAPFGETTIQIGGGNTGVDVDTDENLAFTARARLNFDTSFTGDDRLRVRLQAADDDFDLLNFAGGLANSDDGALDVEINDFYYSFGVGDNLEFIVAANSIATDDFVVSTIVPFDGPAVADAGTPQLYGFDMGGGGFAVGGSAALGENFVIDAGYSADNGEDGSNDPRDGIAGAAEQSYIIQGSYISDGLIDAAIAYMRGNDGDDRNFTNTYAGLLNLDFDGFFVAGTVAWHDNGDDDDFSWMAGAGFEDLFFEGSTFGAYYADLPDYNDRLDPSMFEVYLGIPVNEFLTITPAVVYGDLDTGTLADPGDGSQWYGVIRTTFEF